MAFISVLLLSKKVKLLRTFKFIEVLPIEVRIYNKDVLIIAVCGPPKVSGKDYHTQLEDKLCSLCIWAELQKQNIVIAGDLTLKRLSDQRESKILKDIEDIYGLECLIKDPTRITKNSSTFLDVLLT